VHGLDLGVWVKSYEEIVKILPRDRRPRPIVLIGKWSSKWYICTLNMPVFSTFQLQEKDLSRCSLWRTDWSLNSPEHSGHQYNVSSTHLLVSGRKWKAST